MLKLSDLPHASKYSNIENLPSKCQTQLILQSVEYQRDKNNDISVPTLCQGRLHRGLRGYPQRQPRQLRELLSEPEWQTVALGRGDSGVWILLLRWDAEAIVTGKL